MQKKYLPVGVRAQDYNVAIWISDKVFPRFISTSLRPKRLGALFSFVFIPCLDTKLSINFDTDAFSKCIVIREFMRNMWIPYNSYKKVSMSTLIVTNVTETNQFRPLNQCCFGF
jgi:hypothetical protein